MDKIRLDILGLSSSQTQMGSFALVLGERGGNRRLPIIIGGFEAQAIALEIENIRPNRPMTHDLILSITRSYNINLKEVVISDLREGVFYSRLTLHMDNEYREIDARPSDAIAIAVRYKAPIYTYNFILEEAGIVVRESDIYTEKSEKETEETEKPTSGSPELSHSSQKIKVLYERIEQAIANEDYEEAARLRDEIKRIEEEA